MVKIRIWKLLNILLLSCGLIILSGCMSLFGEWEMKRAVPAPAPVPEVETEPTNVEEIYIVGEVY